MIRRKTGDTRPEEAILLANGQAVDLTGVTTVKFAAKPVAPSTASSITASAVVVQTLVSGKIVDKGRVRWTPTVGQIGDDQAGMFHAEWEVTYPDGTVETFPDGGYEHLELLRDIA